MKAHVVESLEQQRARNAWSCCATCTEEYKRVAKGTPAMIMGSGLMQTLAFMESRKNIEAQQRVATDMRAWLHARYPNLFVSKDYKGFMESLMRLSSTNYQTATVEALSWLKWLRQLAGTTGGASS